MSTETVVTGLSSSAAIVATDLLQQATEAASAWEAEVVAIKKDAADQIKAITKTIEASDRANQLMIGKLNAANAESRKKLYKDIDTIQKQLDKDLINIEAKNKPLDIMNTKPVQKAAEGAGKSIGFLGKGLGWVSNRVKEGMAQAK